MLLTLKTGYGERQVGDQQVTARESRHGRGDSQYVSPDLAYLTCTEPLFIENGQSDHKAKRLAAKVAENQTVVDQLRQERDGLTRDHAELQDRYSKISDVSPLASFPTCNLY